MTFARTLSPSLLAFLALSSPALAQINETPPNPAAPQAPASSAENSPSPTESASAESLPSEQPAPAEPKADDEAPAAPSATTERSAAEPGATAENAPAEPKGDDEAGKPMVLKAQFGKGFTIGTADEKFTLNIRGRLQLQATVADPDGPDNTITEIQARRMRLVFQGNLLGEKLEYYVQLGFANRDEEPDLPIPLRDAYITYAPLRDLNLRFGQMKVPFGRQRVSSSFALSMVDRSIVTTELNLDRDVGIYAFSKDLFGKNGAFGYSLGVLGGEGRNRLGKNAGFLYFARINLRPFGEFDDYKESSVEFEPSPKLAIGLSAAYNQATNRPRSTTGVPYPDSSVAFDYAHLGADFMFKWRGFFATGEWMLRAANQEELAGEDADGNAMDYVSRQAWGAFGQVGQMLTKRFEVNARYGYLEPFGTVSAVPMTHEIGGGVAYYFLGHNLKLQADYFYFSSESNLTQGINQGRLQAQVDF